MLLDCSGSMAYPMAKLRAAKAATAAAIDTLRDGTWFAIVRSTQVAEQCFRKAVSRGRQAKRAERRNAP
jgi:hypothetical protein